MYSYELYTLSVVFSDEVTSSSLSSELSTRPAAATARYQLSFYNCVNFDHCLSFCSMPGFDGVGREPVISAFILQSNSTYLLRSRKITFTLRSP